MNNGEHIICKNDNVSGISYAVKIPAQICERWDKDFLRNHFDLTMATAFTDLKCPGPQAEFALINQAMVNCKIHVISGYAKILDSLIASCPNLLQKPANKKRKIL